MKYVVVGLLLASAACSGQNPSSKPSPTVDDRKVANDQLDASTPKFKSTVDEIGSFALEVGTTLPNDIADDIERATDSDIAAQQASYDANRDNFEATATGVAAGMNAQNRMKDTKIAALKRMRDLKTSSLPFLDRMGKWNDRKTTAVAGRKTIPIGDQLSEASAELVGVRDLLTKYKKMEPKFASKVAGFDGRLAAYEQRLADDIQAYNLLAKRVGQPSVAVSKAKSVS